MIMTVNLYNHYIKYYAGWTVWDIKEDVTEICTTCVVEV